MPQTFTARWVLPIRSPPLEGGTVTVDGERIVAVEPRGARAATVDFGDAALLPGLVNAHTHLDLSGFRTPVAAAGDFPDWLGSVIAHRRQLSPEQVRADVRAGLDESLRHGVTLLGDVSGGGLSWPVLAVGPARAVVFYELLGLSRVRAGLAWAGALSWLREHSATATCRPGLSPHAPYSVRASLFRAAAALAAGCGLPLTVHLAESGAEMELLDRHAGPFVAFLQRLGVWDAEGLARGVEHVVDLHRAAPRTLFAHGNHLAAEVALPPGATVVYCPRTHAHFGHPPHPVGRLLAGGVRVALGTDSRASNPDLDLLAEARWLHAHRPELEPAALLRMATLSGAEALGWEAETGSLEPGKSADLVALPLAGAREPERSVLEADGPPLTVLCRGKRWEGG